MTDHKRLARRLILACVVSCLSLRAAVADEPKAEEKPIPEKMTPHREVAPPVPTVQLKPGEVPAIAFETPVYDFGKAQAGTEVKHDYKFKNMGNGPLEILRVKPGCGCTTAGEHTKVVQPGESGVIPIKLKPGDHAGPVSKRITVSTNIPGNDATVVLEIKGVVWSPVQVTPRSAAFGRLTQDQIAAGLSRKLVVVNNMEAPMKPSAITSTSDAFVAEMKTVEEGRKYELTVTLTNKIVGGNNSTRLTFDTGLDDPKTIDVQAYAFLSPPVDVTPSKLTLPKPRNAELVRSFYIRSNTASPLDVTDVACSADALKLELVDLRGDKRTYRLSVTIPADYNPPAQGDEITFRTSEPSMPVGRIPVTAAMTGETPPRTTAR